jgi:hypothetical protein
MKNIPNFVKVYFFYCGQKNKIEEVITEIPVEIKVERFDKIFFRNTA